MPNPNYIKFEDETVVTAEIAHVGQSITPGTIQSQVHSVGSGDDETLTGEHI